MIVARKNRFKPLKPANVNVA